MHNPIADPRTAGVQGDISAGKFLQPPLQVSDMVRPSKTQGRLLLSCWTSSKFLVDLFDGVFQLLLLLAGLCFDSILKHAVRRKSRSASAKQGLQARIAKRAALERHIVSHLVEKLLLPPKLRYRSKLIHQSGAETVLHGTGDQAGTRPELCADESRQ